MPRIEFAEPVYDDFDRFIAHMTRFAISDPEERIAEIMQALQILSYSPYLGRRIGRGRRELVIGRDERGYVAAYRYSPHSDVVTILAIKSQSERGYKRRH